MQVTGFLIREAIRRWELRRDAAAGHFEDSLHKFKDEQKTHPDEVTKVFAAAESAISKLETAQARYNMTVMVEVQGQKISLCEAVKRIGGAARQEKMWKSAASPKKTRYAFDTSSTERDPTRERSHYILTSIEMVDRANKAAVITGNLRAAIAKGNGTEISREALGLDASLLTE